MTHMSTAVVTMILVGLVACHTLSTMNEFPAGWTDLFRAPYENNPTMAVSIACLDSSFCYVPAATNQVGVNIFTFNGQVNGALVPTTLDGITPIMIMGIGAGGTPAEPHGVAGGPDIFGGLKYLVNSTTWSTPLALPFVALIGITADATGKRVMFPDQLATTDSIWITTDGGFEYSSKNVSAPLPTSNCTYARYIANPTPDVIYMTFGNFPNATKNGDQQTMRDGGKSAGFVSRSYRAGIHFDGQGGAKYVRHSALAARRNNVGDSSSSSSSGIPDLCGFSAAILKSTDGGNSWVTLMQSADVWYPNEISCSSATHCVFVGEGDDGVRIYRTTDGTNFTEVLFVASSDVETRSLQTIAISPTNASIILAAGGKETAAGEEGLFYGSLDGGSTWSEHQNVNFIAEVMQISFGQDGTAFAVAETLFQAATILRYNPNGPPMTPAPAYNGNITQTVCNSSSACNQDCQSSQLPQGVCLPMNGGGSLINVCDMGDQVMIQKVFFLANCEGPAEEQVAPLGVCLNGQGSTIEFLCGTQERSTNQRRPNSKTVFRHANTKS